METKILEEFGLTKNEIKIYLTLLELGLTTTGPIQRHTKLHSSRVYAGLETLIDKGLVKYVIKANRKHFEAIDPSCLFDFLKEKKEKLEKIVPELIKLKKIPKVKQEAYIYEGLKGIKSVLELALKTFKKGEVYYVLGAPKIVNEKIEGFLLDTHKRRIAKGVKFKIIYNYDAREYGKKRAKMRLTEVRYTPKRIITPAWVEIFGDYVATYLLTENPIVFVIKNRDIAQSYLKYFEFMWEFAKK